MSPGPGGSGWGPASTLAAALAREWAGQLRAAGLRQRTSRELELLLRSQADLLLRTLHVEPFVPDPAREVGAYLVELQATGADALQRTFLLLTGRLLDESALTAESGRHRLDLLLGEFIGGWADAMHTHILAAQDELRRALDAARRGWPDPPPDPPDPPDSPDLWFS